MNQHTQTISLKIKISLSGEDLATFSRIIHYWKISITSIEYPDIHSAIWSLEFTGTPAQCQGIKERLACRVWTKSEASK